MSDDPPLPAKPPQDPRHDRGLSYDLSVLQRRPLLTAGLVVAGLAGALWATRGARPVVIGIAEDGNTCVAGPAETAGPFPADGSAAAGDSPANVLAQTGVLRRDLRPSFAGLSPVAEGIAMTLRLQLVDVAQGCAPRAGHAVYVWHCDAAGRYSIYEAPDRNCLRGLGITDAGGEVTFETILPACYAGRWPHVHVQVFASAGAAAAGEAALLVSQLALPEAVVAPLYAADPRYAASTGRLAAVRFETDAVFADNAPQERAAQMLDLSGDATAGLVATAVIGLA